MITGFDISKTLYGILNVSSVTSLISGKIYREALPLERSVTDLQNIVISPLLNMVDEFITEATVNVNIYCKNKSNGQPDITKLESISSAVMTVLNAYVPPLSYFSLTVVSNQLFQDDTFMSFINLRIEIFTI